MKLITLASIILACAIFCGCGGTTKKTNGAGSRPHSNHDYRPKDEIAFLNKVKAESAITLTTDTAQMQAHIDAFDKYAEDSLKKITNWEMIVTEVNDDPNRISSFVKMLFKKDNDIYNVVLVAPIKIDNSVDGVDNIASNNRVNFTYTILKDPQPDFLKKRVDYIQKLQKGDTLIVSGRLMHIDKNLKMTYGSFYNKKQPWNIDLIPTVFLKKGE